MCHLMFIDNSTIAFPLNKINNVPFHHFANSFNALIVLLTQPHHLSF